MPASRVSLRSPPALPCSIAPARAPHDAFSSSPPRCCSPRRSRRRALDDTSPYGGSFNAPGYPNSSRSQPAGNGLQPNNAQNPNRADAARHQQRQSGPERTADPAQSADRPAADTRSPSPAPIAVAAAAEAERVPELRRGRDRPAAADVRLDLLRRRRRHASIASTTCRCRPTTRSARATRSMPARLGLDRRRLPHHGRPQRHAEPAEGRQLQRRRRQGRPTSSATCARRSGASTPTSTSSVSLGQLRGLSVFVVGPAQRPGVYTLPSQSTLLSAVVAAGGPSPIGSMRKIAAAPRRQGRSPSSTSTSSWSRATSRRTSSSPPATSSSSSRPGARVALTGAIDTPAIYELKSAQEPLARRAALRRRRAGARQPEPRPARAHRSGAAARHALRRDVPRSTPTGLQKPLRDGDVADPARDLAAVRQRGDAEGPRRPAAALSVHARACASAT